MIEEFRAVSMLINQELIGLRDGTATVIESKPGGRCVAHFEAVGPHVFLKPASDNHPIAWMREQKCSDGAFITSDARGRLHIRLVELKSRIKIDDWVSIRRQFAGMYLNVCAFLGFADIERNARVTCYLVYTRDEVRADRTASSVLLKLGAEGARAASNDWKSFRVSLPRGVVATLVRKIRGENREVTFPPDHPEEPLDVVLPQPLAPSSSEEPSGPTPDA